MYWEPKKEGSGEKRKRVRQANLNMFLPFFKKSRFSVSGTRNGDKLISLTTTSALLNTHVLKIKTGKKMTHTLIDQTSVDPSNSSSTINFPRPNRFTT